MISLREMETLLRNVDRRTVRMEQILPTLATKEDLAAAIAPLATKDELAAAIAPLATKEGLAEVRRHAMVLNEAVRDDIRMLAEHLAGLIDSRSRNQ